MSQSRFSPPPECDPILLGMGNNIDYEIIWETATLERLIAEYAIDADELPAPPAAEIRIGSERELLVSILRHMAASSGGEHSVDSLPIITGYARRFQYHVSLGGTAVRAALAMRTLGYRAMIHLVTLNESVQALLPADCQWVCSNPSNRIYPHLIVQYPAGARIRVGTTSISASRANRIIYVNDPDNSQMRLSPELGRFIDRARVVLISGFNVMPDTGELANRLRHLENALAASRQKKWVVAEDAGFHIQDHSQLTRRAISRFADIHSMNEDELAGHIQRPIDLLDAKDVADAMGQLQSLSTVPVLIVHTRHWALAWVRDPSSQKASRFGQALESAIALATTRLRLGNDFRRSDVEATGRLARQAASERFAASLMRLAGDRVCCIPGFQIANEVTTVGLGDTFVGGLLPRLLNLDC